MPTVQPLVYIEPPTLELVEYGLFSVANSLGIGDDHWQFGGAEFESLAAVAAGFYPVGIGMDAGAGGTKTLPAGAGTTKALPFAIYAGVSCGSVGYTEEQFRARAIRVLELAGQHAAEEALWTGAGGETPKLNAASTTTVVAGAQTIKRAVAALEDWIGDQYHARALIHAKRGVSAIAAERMLVESDPVEPRRKQTPVGTLWSFGAGYAGNGPNAVAAAAGTTWIYATGQVGIQTSTPTTPAGMGQAIDKRKNLVDLYAEQEMLLTVDGAIGAVLVDLTS